MNKNIRQLLFITLVLCVCLGGACDRKHKIYTIALISPGINKTYLDGFKAGMAEHGYIEGEQVIYIEKMGVRIPELEAVIQEMIATPLDLLFAIGTPTALIAKQVTKGTGIPVVFAAVSDPVDAGVVDDYIKPGGNLTGVRSGGQMPKMLEWLLMLIPDIQRLWVPYYAKDQGLVEAFSDLQQAAAARNVELIVADVATEEELFTILKTTPDNVDAILHLPSSFLNPHIQQIAEYAIERRIPLASGIGIFYQQGALLSYGSDGFSMCKQASRLARQILKGVAPQDLPVETAEFFLGLNLQIAGAINIDIPEHILEQASNIIR